MKNCHEKRVSTSISVSYTHLATKEELIDYATRSGAPLEVLENLQEIEDEGDVYESIEDILSLIHIFHS